MEWSDWSSQSLPGPEGFIRVKSKSLGALRRRSGHHLIYEESDDRERRDKKSFQQLLSVTRKEWHAGVEMTRASRKAVPLELQQLGPRSKSASSLYDSVSRSEAVDSKEFSDQPVRNISTASEQSDEAERLDLVKLSEAPHTGLCSPSSKPKLALDDVVQKNHEECSSNGRKASQKSKKSKQNKTQIADLPSGIRAQPGNFMRPVEHDEAAEVALAEAARACPLDPPAPAPLSSMSSPKPPTSSAAQNFASIRTVDTPKRTSRLPWTVPDEALCRNGSARTIDCILAPEKVRFGIEDSAKDSGETLIVWDTCKDVYCAWGDADDDWGHDGDDWPMNDATLAWE